MVAESNDTCPSIHLAVHFDSLPWLNAELALKLTHKACRGEGSRGNHNTDAAASPEQDRKTGAAQQGCSTVSEKAGRQRGQR